MSFGDKLKKGLGKATRNVKKMGKGIVKQGKKIGKDGKAMVKGFDKSVKKFKDGNVKGGFSEMGKAYVKSSDMALATVGLGVKATYAPMAAVTAVSAGATDAVLSAATGKDMDYASRVTQAISVDNIWDSVAKTATDSRDAAFRIPTDLKDGKLKEAVMDTFTAGMAFTPQSFGAGVALNAASDIEKNDLRTNAFDDDNEGDKKNNAGKSPDGKNGAEGGKGGKDGKGGKADKEKQEDETKTEDENTFFSSDFAQKAIVVIGVVALGAVAYKVISRKRKRDSMDDGAELAPSAPPPPTFTNPSSTEQT